VSSLGEQPPKSGGRVTLKLASLEGERVRYLFTLITSQDQHDGSLCIDLAEGRVEIEEGQPGSQDAWMMDLVHSLVRGAWRGREQYGWPRRITRWRPTPRVRGE
jgi:hypothetical protein